MLTETRHFMKSGVVMRKIPFAVALLLITIVGACGTGYKAQGPLQIQEQVRARHILIKKPAATDPDVADHSDAQNKGNAAALAKAEKLLEQIENGADFEALAREHSNCASAAQGGDLGFFPRGRMVANFEKAAFDLKVGQVSEIVETNFGYHIIKATDRRHVVIRPASMFYDSRFVYDDHIYLKPDLHSFYNTPELHIPPVPDVGYSVPPSLDIPNQNISRQSWYIPLRPEFTQPTVLPRIEVISTPKYQPIDIEPIRIPHADFPRIEPLPAPKY